MNWIFNKKIDLIFIISPPFITLFLLLIFSSELETFSSLHPTIPWVVLIILIDVAHVWGTLFKTYLVKKTFLSHKKLFIFTPLICFVFSLILLQVSQLFFWSILAFIAIFHFIRQQYGILKMYSRYENQMSKILNTITIYTITLYPILYWICLKNRKFNWFVENEFYLIPDSTLYQYAYYFYLLVLFVYVIHEIYVFIRYKTIQIPKNLFIISTFISWYFGIIYFNSDIAFTALNVISHGVPYISLILFKEVLPAKNEYVIANNLLKSKYAWILFFTIIFLLALFEEFIWDVSIWKEHISLFLELDLPFKNWIIAFLTIPQFTHYILDGFIWKRSFSQ